MASTAVLYLLYFVVFYFFAPVSVGFGVHAVEPGQPRAEEPMFLYLRPYFKALLAFAAVATPVLIGLLKFFKR